MTVSTIADLDTPTSLFLKLRDLQPCFLLESVTHGQNVGRYSFIGLQPRKTVEYHGDGKLMDLIERELDGLGESGDLTAGLVGAVAGENVHEFLPTRLERSGRPDQPLAAFVVPGAVVTFDHVDRRLTLEHHEGEAAAEGMMQQVRDLMNSPLPRLQGGSSASEPKATVSRDAFKGMVERAKDHILAGDIFQVVLSLAFEGETDLHPYQVYRALRHLNPSPYLYYLDFGGYQIIGSSPEALVKLNNGQLMIRPIAGTRPRGANKPEDEELESELKADPKELAEHNMLVDLARNDVGRVSEIGSVGVPDLRQIERYSHVMHLCSTVTGKLAENRTPLEAFAGAFPAGTVSGAPQIRALQIIDELEPAPRGFYAGSVGYFTKGGEFDQAITIRTIIMNEGKFTAQAGAGIVADSDPDREYDEITNKAAALLKALEFAKELQ
ncbi:MAG: anthranilate synthase component I family protein [Planctomycetota bacterium]